MAAGKKILGEKLAALRDASFQTQQEWASALGWSVSNYRRLEKPGLVGISLDSLRDLASFLKMEPGEVLEAIGPNGHHVALRNTGPAGPMFFQPPTYDLPPSASHWSELTGAEDQTLETNPRIIDQGLFRVRIHGDCMEPRWKDDELIEFEIWREGSAPAPIGEDVVVTTSDGLTTFKTLVEWGEDQVVLRPRNPKYSEPLIVPRQMVARLAVATGVFFVRPK